MSEPRTARDVATELDRLRQRIDNVTATVLDKELWARLSPIRDHVATTAALLAESTPDALRQVNARLRVAEAELAAVLKLPRTAR